MQFYLDGYRPGDPFVAEPHPSVAERPDGLPEEVDVLIVGCGPAGLVLAAQLAQFPEITTAIVDRRDGPLEVGQADGVAVRTVEMFEAFGLAGRLVDEAYWVNEVTFWRPDPDDPARITRTGRVLDTEEGLSEFPHVIVNQARMLTFLREHMERSASRLRPFYGLQAADVQIDGADSSEHPVTVTLRHLENGAETGRTSTVRAKYVVGCDGARSSIRTAIGRELVGDPMNQSWGVMDVLAVTDFPDIRLKSAIHSANQGNILIIPREGGYLVRLYIELDAVGDREMLENRSITPEKLTAVANRILAPYTLDVRDVGWWSVYEIGQRLCDKFDDVPAAETPDRLPRVFIAGDACHTHSAKAGQGMNVSMADAWNLGWKLGTVLRGTARPELLHTYSEERQAVAEELIAFDREFARMFSAPPKKDGEEHGVDPEEFQRYFVQQGRFTAGVATRYEPSMITAEPTFQPLARASRSGCGSTPPRSSGSPTPSRSSSATRRGRTAPGGCTSSPTGRTRRARLAGRRRCASSWRRRSRRSAGSPRPARTPTRSSTSAPSSSSRTASWPWTAAVGSRSPQGTARAWWTTRRSSAPTRRPATYSTCAGSTGSRAASSSSAPTSTSRTSCHWTPTTS